MSRWQWLVGWKARLEDGERRSGADTRVCRVDTHVDAFRCFQALPSPCPGSDALSQSVETSLDAADTSVRATNNEQLRELRCAACLIY
jgi:hypothetical protein